MSNLQTATTGTKAGTANMGRISGCTANTAATHPDTAIHHSISKV
jgi:hypothetical protein